jgi:hypothetical protein
MLTKPFTGKLEFWSPVNIENSFGSVNLSLNVKSEITIKIRECGSGFAEWEIPRLKEYEEIGLSFDGNMLIDYDGVFSLPSELVSFLKVQGYDMSYAE